ncbi:hypothetical protein BGZ46_006093 [Entomortierella lignicola]|nr:hypothetical protein BGZ46_006093 [Entomortierella lignicola]
MEPELKHQLSVEDPMEEAELNLDGLKISSILVLLEPPTSLPGGDEDEEDDIFYSPLDHFQHLVKLSMSSAQCESLEGFPKLRLLKSLILADNKLSSGFEALAAADLQKLALLDLSGNNISDVSVLEPLVELENLQHLLLAENEIASKEKYRDDVFYILPQLITVDGLDRDGTEIEVDEDDVLSADEDEEQYQEGNAESEEDEGENNENEDIGGEDVNNSDNDDDDDDDEEVESGSESEIEDQENRPPTVGGKTSGESRRRDDDDDDEDDDDELDEDEEFDDQHQQHQHPHQSHEVLSGSDEEDEEDEDEEEEEEEEEEDDVEEEEGPGLAYLLTEDIPDENDEEFEPTNEAEEESDMESSDEDEFGNNNGGDQSSSVNKTNGSHTKRPRSPALASIGDFDHGQAAAGFDVDGDDATNGFGMASFDGPATFDDETTHESKRPRT